MSLTKLLEAVKAAENVHRHRHKALVMRTTVQAVSWILAQYWRLQCTKLINAMEPMRLRFGESLRESEFDDAFDAVFDEIAQNGADNLSRALASALTPSYKAGAQAATAGMADLPASFDLLNLPATDFLRDHGADLITQINDTTRDDIRDLLTRGREEGWSYDKTAQAIRSAYAGFDSYRSQMVGRTESAFAYEQGAAASIANLESYGLQFVKEWLTGPSGGCIEICNPNADQEYIPRDQSFQSGDDEPPGHPNCGCTCLYERVEDAS